jgi:ABC-type nitrate/sulfonate/bicarbonate transport system substrate-binding protein
MIEAQAAAARVLAERTAAASPTPAPDAKASSTDSSNHAQTVARGDSEKTASASADATDRLVAVLMVRPDVKSVSDLAGKTVAIDDRYSASNGSVRTAIVAAGASEVQLSEGPTTAINRLVDGEVPAAVLALVAPEAAERFPAIAGFKTFQIPLSPHSAKGRP